MSKVAAVLKNKGSCEAPACGRGPAADMAIDNMGASALLIDAEDGTVRYVNNTACRNLGMRRQDLLNRCYKDFFWPEFIPVFETLLRQCEDGAEHAIIYYWSERAVWEQVLATPLPLEGRPCFLLTITNISEVALTKYMSDNAVSFDSFLKLPNGLKLEEDISTLANLETVALIYFTTESLSIINDLYGWNNGDNLLTQIRDWLIFSEPNRAQLYRMEKGFALLGRGVSIDDAKERAESISRRFEQPWTLSAGGRNISVFCAIRMGIVYGKYVKNEMRNLLMRTIDATRRAGEYIVYDEDVDRESRRRLMIRDSLINCIHNGMKGFELHYQPIVETKTGRWAAVEALCRWTMPDGTKVPPNVFIHAAEQLGMIGELDAWVRKKAMQQCVALGLHEKDFILDINFSPTKQIDESFIEELRTALTKTGFPASKLNLEVTESVRMPLDRENLEGLRLIAEQGIQLSLDDFGTGYSTLENLIKISANVLKTDKLFLDGIEDNQYKRYLLRMLVDLAKYLDMRMVAEGVEEENQFALLQNYGVDYIQGYLCSRPLTFDQLSQQIDRFN